MTQDEFRDQFSGTVSRQRMGISLTEEQALSVLADDAMLYRWYTWSGAANYVRVVSPPPHVSQRQPLSWFAKSMIAMPFLLVIAGVLGYYNTQVQADPDRGNSDIAAIYACEEAVAQNLKSPASADFNSSAAGGNPWVVQGVVDSENSFGARLRSTFECSVTFRNGASQTTVVRLE
ncbi:hypothetical protein [Cryobacterium sp. MLB-32]|uniref:hypothetical protein n=1 Tax=Cryobacterium sp. MLB-32 TaxID=1529318 RepID=UPI00068C0133|nr:hypothetical protein [Cryobacterium sp. MLB-32]